MAMPPRLLLPLLFAGAIVAAEGGDPAGERQRAAALAEPARAVLRAFRSDPAGHARELPAAITALSEARDLAERAGDTEALCDLEADLLWGRRQLAQAEVRARAVPEAVQQAEARSQGSERAVDPAQAGAFLARAERFAAEHGDDHFQISVRFFEVAERFAGTPEAVKAQRLSLAASEAFLRARQEAARRSLFSSQGSRGTLAMPAAAAVKAQATELRRLWAAAFADTSTGGRRTLCRRLVDEAPRRLGEPPVHAALLAEALRVAAECDELAVIAQASELLAATYAGGDATTERRTAFARLRTRALGVAASTLLDRPEDPAAAGLVGRHLAVELGRWDLALPLLARGDETELARAVQMELANPALGDEQLATALAWRDLGRRQARSEERLAYLARARTWLERALPQLDEQRRGEAERAQAELAKESPFDLRNGDFTTLTAAQWELFKGQVLSVGVRPDRCDTGLALKPGEKVRVVPHPADTWTIENARRQPVLCNWRGAVGRNNEVGDWGIDGFEPRAPGLPTGGLVVWLDTRQPEAPTRVITGPGRLFLAANKVGIANGAKGELRVKVIAVRDE